MYLLIVTVKLSCDQIMLTFLNKKQNFSISEAVFDKKDFRWIISAFVKFS